MTTHSSTFQGQTDRPCRLVSFTGSDLGRACGPQQHPYTPVLSARKNRWEQHGPSPALGSEWRNMLEVGLRPQEVFQQTNRR